MSNRIILVGKAGSGKDFFRKKFTDKGFKYATSYTTRPSRTGEVQGLDYNFISKEKFEKLIKMDFWYEYVPFNGWYYGTSKIQFREDDIFIMTPTGISHLKEKDRSESLIMYLDIPYEFRKERLKLRSDADSVDRRLVADESDFKDFANFDIRITNPDF
jgi:guanylate kinase